MLVLFGGESVEGRVIRITHGEPTVELRDSDGEAFSKEFEVASVWPIPEFLSEEKLRALRTLHRGIRAPRD